MQLKLVALAALSSLALAQDQPPETAGTLNATLAGHPQLTNITSFLNANPALLTALGSANDITVLAPSDEAFAAFADTSAAQGLATDPGLLTAVLQYHVLNGSIASDQISETSTFAHTLLTNETYTNVTDGQVVQALAVANDVVFISGLLSTAVVTEADIEFSGGVIHIIDTVLTLPATVVETAAAANLTALRGAVSAANLVATVNETPDLTIFAPTSEAFKAIGSALANLSMADLTTILAYHVVNGTVGYSTTLENDMTLTTLGGGELEITIDEDGNVFVNAAQVIVTDVLVANGVVHVIDQVLNPSNTEGPSPDATAGAPGFTATPGSDIPYTSGQPTPTTTISRQSEGEGAATSSQFTGAAMPAVTGAVGYGALLGAGAAVFL